MVTKIYTSNKKNEITEVKFGLNQSKNYLMALAALNERYWLQSKKSLFWFAPCKRP